MVLMLSMMVIECFYYVNWLFLADVPVNKVDSSSSTTRGARAKRQGTKIVCVYIRVSYVHVRVRLFIAACSSKKSGSGVASKSSTVENCHFTSAETALFERRYENQYDRTTDKQYNRWLSLNHPDNPLNPQQPHEDNSLNPFPSQQPDPLEEVHMPAQVANTRSTLSKLLSFEEPPQRPQPPKGRAFVATRSEKIAELQAKTSSQNFKPKKRREIKIF